MDIQRKKNFHMEYYFLYGFYIRWWLLLLWFSIFFLSFTFAVALPGSNFLSIPFYFLQQKISKENKWLREIDKCTHKEIKGGNKLNWKLKRTYSLTARQESLSNSIWKRTAHKHGFEATTTMLKTNTTTIHTRNRVYRWIDEIFHKLTHRHIHRACTKHTSTSIQSSIEVAQKCCVLKCLFVVPHTNTLSRRQQREENHSQHYRARW